MKTLFAIASLFGVAACAGMDPCADKPGCTAVGHSTATEIVFVHDGKVVETWPRIGGMSPLQDK